MYMQATDLDAPVRPLIAALTIAMVSALGLAGCDSGPIGPDSHSANSSSAPSASAHQSSESCTTVRGSGHISGSARPNDQGNVTASGPVEGGVSGTLTLKRDPDATTQRGMITTAFYKEVRLATNELGTFTGTARGLFNLKPANFLVVQIEFKHGSMDLRGSFDLSNFPPIIRADFEYTARLCPGES